MVAKINRLSIRKPGGYGLVSGPPDVFEEHDTFTCPHCSSICIVRPGSGTQRGFCFRCNAPTCGKTACRSCVPFERKLEAMENRHRLYKVMERGYDNA